VRRVLRRTLPALAESSPAFAIDLCSFELSTVVGGNVRRMAVGHCRSALGVRGSRRLGRADRSTPHIASLPSSLPVRLSVLAALARCGLIKHCHGRCG
jgi:hypothetical protein